MNFKCLTALENQLGWFQRQPDRWASSMVLCLPPRAGRLQAAACMHKPRRPEMLSASFCLHSVLSSRWGDATGVTLCSRGVCCGTAVPQHTGWASACVGGGEELNPDPSEVLQSSSTHQEAATSLNASRLLCSQPWSLLLPRAIWAVALLAWSTGYPRSTCASPAASALCRGLPACSAGGGGDFYVIPWEPIWFQTQALDHLICIFPHLRVPGKGRGELKP